MQQNFDAATLRIDGPFRLCIAAWRAASGSRPLILLYVAMLIGSQLVTLSIPWLFGHAIDAVQAGRPIDGALDLGVVLGAALTAWALHGPARVLERTVAMRIRRRVADGFLRHVLSLRLAWHDAEHSGDTISRMLRASEALTGFTENSFIYLQSAVNLVGPLVAMFVLSHRVGAVAMLGYSLIAFVMIRFDRVFVRLVRTQIVAERKYAAALTDCLGNARTIITLRLQDAVRAVVGRRLEEIFVPARSAIRVNEMKWCAVDLINAVMRCGLVVLYGGLALHDGATIAVGVVLMIYQYAQQIGGVVSNMAGNCQQLLRHHADFGGMGDVLAEPAEVADSHILPPDWSRIDIEDLSFTYAGADRPAVNHVTLRLTRGRSIAVVGESGSGKSSLLALLVGLYEASSGHILVDGVAVPARHLGSLATLIPQDPQVFEGTVLDNITLGIDRPALEVGAACRIAQLDPFIGTLPGGLSFEVKERGANLSGGQRQRLAVARGVLAARGSSLILLDEPTSSLDGPTESEVYDGLMAAHSDACIVSTLHRFELLDRFDEVVWMEAGRILDVGSARDLLVRQPGFRRLYASALALVADEAAA